MTVTTQMQTYGHPNVAVPMQLSDWYRENNPNITIITTKPQKTIQIITTKQQKTNHKQTINKYPQETIINKQ